MKPKFTFEDIWGHEVKTGGFVQVPNDLIRNIGHLRLTGNQILLLLVIMSYGRDSMLTVRRISIHSGLHPNTIRSDIRKLAARKLIYRKWGKGTPSIYTFDTLINKVKAYPKIRHALSQNLDMGLDDIYSVVEQELDTNIDKENKDKDDQGGMDKYRKRRSDLGI